MFGGTDYPVSFHDLWRGESKRMTLDFENTRLMVALDCLDPNGNIVVVDSKQAWYFIAPNEWCKIQPLDPNGPGWLELALTFARAEEKRAAAESEESDEWEAI